MNGSHGSHTYREIMSQGTSWLATLEGLRELPGQVNELIKKPFDEVLFIGCGSTHYLSQTAAAFWQSKTGIRARGVPASELWLFPDTVVSEKPTLLVCISRSGETTETVRAAELFQERTGQEVLSISCYGESRLATQIPNSLVARDAEEESIAQTRSFSSMLLITQAIAALAAGNTDYVEQLNKLPGLFDRLVSKHEELLKDIAENKKLNHFVFLGSGPNYGLANEAMLKMKEMSLSQSEAFHFMEFRHGPKSVVAPETMIVGLVSDSAWEQEVKVLEEMRGLGATVLAILDSPRNISADHVIEMGSGIDKDFHGPLSLPFLQLLAYYRALSKKLDPDKPTNLEAVVKL